VRICYFGTYEQDYVRNRTVIEGLRKNGCEVQECHVPLWERQRDKTGGYLKAVSLAIRAVEVGLAYVRLLFIYLFTVRPYDVLMVGYIGHLDMPLAWLLSRIPRRPLVFNPLVSLYDTLVDDRAVFSERSIMGRFLHGLDVWSCRAADLVLLDTDQHISYFVETFGLPRSKFLRVFVGVDESVFNHRMERPGDSDFRIIFVGKYTPLHGIDTMIQAAKLLSNEPTIRFQFIGSGQLSNKIQSLCQQLKVTNVTFSDWVPYADLPDTIAQSDICLGIVGTTDKASRVIPGKVFWAMSMGRPVLTGDSPATRELLTDGENALLCKRGDPESLSRAILRARNDPDLLKRIGRRGRETYLAHASEQRIGETVVGALERLSA
jgi:glycosyltransferase involved in cell wall biosynthesis